MRKQHGIKKALGYNKVLDAIKASLEASNGTFKIITTPNVVTDFDEEEIKKRMELLEKDKDSESEEGEDDDGLIAPKGLDQKADAEEARSKDEK